MKDSAFKNTNVSNIIIPKSVTSIGHSTFAHCNNLNEIYIHANPVLMINDNTFDGSNGFNIIMNYTEWERWQKRPHIESNTYNNLNLYGGSNINIILYNIPTSEPTDRPIGLRLNPDASRSAS